MFHGVCFSSNLKKSSIPGTWLFTAMQLTLSLRPFSPHLHPPPQKKTLGRLQLASAFSLWARLSAAASHSDRRAETAASAKRHRNLRLCLSTLRGNASLRRRARLALTSLDRRCRLRRLSRGWTAVVGAAAAGSAERRGELRLGRAEAAVAAGRMAARARAHRTARRLLGVARGRAALEAFVAWRGLVREGRGARLGAAALAGRCAYSCYYRCCCCCCCR